MQSEGFPSCCGILIIHSLDVPNTWDYANHTFKADVVKEFIEGHEKPFKGQYYLIAINNHQAKSGMDKILEECGYKCIIDSAYNPNSGNQIYLYAKARYKRNGRKGTLKSLFNNTTEKSDGTQSK